MKNRIKIFMFLLTISTVYSCQDSQLEEMDIVAQKNRAMDPADCVGDCPTTEDESDLTTPPALNKTISVLTLNVGWVPEDANEAISSSDWGYGVYAEVVANYIFTKNADVVIVQEAFDKSVLKDFTNEMRLEYPYNTDQDEATLTSWELTFQETDGHGIVIYSKFPITDQDHFNFTGGCATWDCYADKGYALAKIKLGDARYAYILGTHLQSGGDPEDYDIRRSQIDEIKDGILSKNDQYSRYYPFILAGDFNIEADGSGKPAEQANYDYLTDKLLAIPSNDWTQEAPMTTTVDFKVLDYIFTSSLNELAPGHLDPISVTYDGADCYTLEPINFGPSGWPSTLSDHCMVKSTFTYALTYSSGSSNPNPDS